MQSGWWTISQAAQYCQLSTGVLYRECAAGRLKHVRIGGRRDIRIKGPDAVDAWLAGRWRGDGEPSAEPHDDASRARSFPRDATKAG